MWTVNNKQSIAIAVCDSFCCCWAVQYWGLNQGVNANQKALINLISFSYIFQSANLLTLSGVQRWLNHLLLECWIEFYSGFWMRCIWNLCWNQTLSYTLHVLHVIGPPACFWMNELIICTQRSLIVGQTWILWYESSNFI